MRLIIPLVLSCSVLFGCAVTPVNSPATAESPSRITVKAAGLDDRRQDIVLKPYAGKLSAWFPVVRGSINGTPTDTAIYSVPVKLGEDFILDLQQLEAAARPCAMPVAGEMRTPSVQIEPDAMKLVRIGTYFYDEQRSSRASGAGFVDSVSREPMTLVYFDRAGTIKGTFTSYEDNVDIDIKIQEPGFAWLRVTRVDGGYRYRNSTGAGKILFGTFGVKK